MKILVVGPSWVGDMVMAQSLFKILKHNYDDVIIDVLALAWSKPVLERMPEVNLAIEMPIGHGNFNLLARYRLGKKLQKENYDQAIVLPNSFKSALVPFFAKIPKRTGWLGEMRWGLLNDVRYLNKKTYTKMVERFVALAYPKATKKSELRIFCPRLKASREGAITALNKLGYSAPVKPVLAICPGASYGPSKRWPGTYYETVAQEKIRAGWEVWIFGSKDDKPITDKIASFLVGKHINFSGNIVLSETIDLFSLCDAIITNDSGLMHIAASLNKPVVAIYGSTSPDFTPPLSKNAKMLQTNLSCHPCFKRKCLYKHYHCLYNIKPELVLRELNNLLVS